MHSEIPRSAWAEIEQSTVEEADEQHIIIQYFHSLTSDVGGEPLVAMYMMYLPCTYSKLFGAEVPPNL